jgi:hypothetical protein
VATSPPQELDVWGPEGPVHLVPYNVERRDQSICFIIDPILRDISHLIVFVPGDNPVMIAAKLQHKDLVRQLYYFFLFFIFYFFFIVHYCLVFYFLDICSLFC